VGKFGRVKRDMLIEFLPKAIVSTTRVTSWSCLHVDTKAYSDHWERFVIILRIIDGDDGGWSPIVGIVLCIDEIIDLKGGFVLPNLFGFRLELSQLIGPSIDKSVT
jgi:hypothetical protein